MGQLWGFVPGEAFGFLKEVWGMQKESHSSPPAGKGQVPGKRSSPVVLLP